MARRQDAARDAEGSSVADIVRRADPEGDRTVFVLTKVDLAEKLHLPAAKLQAILKGEKFNMQARAYFAVVTGQLVTHSRHSFTHRPYPLVCFCISLVCFFLSSYSPSSETLYLRCSLCLSTSACARLPRRGTISISYASVLIPVAEMRCDQTAPRQDLS